jgi:CubicO group peptidase (beta-lactamase class C family)
LASLSAAVGSDDRLLWAGATGWADIEKVIPARVTSRFRTGSLAKPITATALVRLQEAGRVDLDAPISTYVADLPPALQPLTARLLASHQAGIRHYSMVPSWWWGWHESSSTRHYASVADGLAIFAEDDLVFAPGTGFRYTTFGYSLLARLMEGASGRPFDVVLSEQVLGPAGMRDTAVDGPAPMPERVAFYQAEGGRYTASYPIDSSNKIAGGGLVSTPSDLVRLGQALLGDELVSAAGKQVLFTPLALADGSMNPQNYALGWRIDTSVRLLGEDRPTSIIHHGGAQAGAGAFLMLLPEHGISIAVMSNSGTGTARAEAQEAAYVLARLVIDR